MSDDDDLRFGDVSGESSNNQSDNDILDLFTQIIIGLMMLYIVLVMAETLFNIPIPFI